MKEDPEMTRLAGEVTRLVDEFEKKASEDPDALATRALIQGMLFGTLLDHKQRGGLAIVDVELHRDDEDDYEHHFIVHMRSGARIRVSVEVEK